MDESVLGHQSTSSSIQLEDLPQDVLLHIMQHLPTETLVALATAHEALHSIVSDVKFLDRQTKKVLGFPLTCRDITYDIVPRPVAPVQELWYNSYLSRAAPYLVGVIRPGIIFYDLLCFRHLLDTWFLQATGLKYGTFVRLVVNSDDRPPFSILKLKHVGMQPPVRRILTRVFLCKPEVLLVTINKFEVLNLNYFGPADLDEAWHRGVPAEWKAGFSPQISVEVVSRDRGMTLASFLLVWEPQLCIGWAGVIDYSTFRCRNTWSVCKIPSRVQLGEIAGTLDEFFSRFLNFLGPDYIAFDSTGPFFYKGLCKLMHEKQHLMTQLQEALERVARYVTRKIKTRLKDADRRGCAVLMKYLDSVWLTPPYADSEEERAVLMPGDPGRRLRESSKNLEVSIERYTHRGLNRLIGREVLRYYADPVCHRALCLACRNRQASEMKNISGCLCRVHWNRLPLKIWPPHLLCFALSVMPALEKVVRVDIELWMRGLHTRPPSAKVVTFVRAVLNAVNLEFSIEEGEVGPVLGMVQL